VKNRILDRRLWNQRVSKTDFTKPKQVVEWLGAVQAQDYGAAKWALGLRAIGLTEAAVEREYNEGRILRTHILRPTWHFVSPADIRWMLSLSAPRVHMVSGSQYRKLELDERTLARSRKSLERALEGGRSLTRAEAGAALTRAGIPAEGQRLAYIMMFHELEQVISSGPRRGKQFTYMLLDERAPAVKPALDRDEALAEMTRRYFTSHGPAILRDFVWWSGLTMREAKAGVAMNGRKIVAETDGERTYYSVPSRSEPVSAAGSVHLLPIYDEYLISYKDRSALKLPPQPGDRAHDEFAHFLMVDGQLAGTWRREYAAARVHVSVKPYRPLGRKHARALVETTNRLAAFQERTATLSV
jgi:hypothetical protein